MPNIHIEISNSKSPFKKSGNLKTSPPIIIGKDNKKENRVASSRDRPNALEIVNVAPERLTPGKMARDWNRPINDAFFKSTVENI